MDLRFCRGSSLVLLVFLLLAAADSLFGQDVARPITAGIPAYCRDATEATMDSRLLRTFIDGAASTIGASTGERLILVNYSVASYMPPMFQPFMYAHGYDHHN